MPWYIKKAKKKVKTELNEEEEAEVKPRPVWRGFVCNETSRQAGGRHWSTAQGLVLHSQSPELPALPFKF